MADISATDLDTIYRICADLEVQCNLLVNGQCMSAACLLRGGASWARGVPPDYRLATCRELEQSRALRRIADAHRGEPT